MAKLRKLISAQATSILLAGIESDKPPVVISGEIAASTGEKLSPRTIARRKANYWTHRQVNEQAATRSALVIKKLNDLGIQGSDLLEAGMKQAFMNEPELIVADPKLLLMADANRIKRETNQIRRDRNAIDSRRLALLEARDARATAVVSAAQTGKIDPKEALESIYALFGRPKPSPVKVAA